MDGTSYRWHLSRPYESLAPTLFVQNRWITLLSLHVPLNEMAKAEPYFRFGDIMDASMGLKFNRESKMLHILSVPLKIVVYAFGITGSPPCSKISLEYAAQQFFFREEIR